MKHIRIVTSVILLGLIIGLFPQSGFAQSAIEDEYQQAVWDRFEEFYGKSTTKELFFSEYDYAHVLTVKQHASGVRKLLTDLGFALIEETPNVEDYMVYLSVLIELRNMSFQDAKDTQSRYDSSKDLDKYAIDGFLVATDFFLGFVDKQRTAAKVITKMIDMLSDTNKGLSYSINQIESITKIMNNYMSNKEFLGAIIEYSSDPLLTKAAGYMSDIEDYMLEFSAKNFTYIEVYALGLIGLKSKEVYDFIIDLNLPNDLRKALTLMKDALDIVFDIEVFKATGVGLLIDATSFAADFLVGNGYRHLKEMEFICKVADALQEAIRDICSMPISNMLAHPELFSLQARYDAVCEVVPMFQMLSYARVRGEYCFYSMVTDRKSLLTGWGIKREDADKYYADVISLFSGVEQELESIFDPVDLPFTVISTGDRVGDYIFIKSAPSEIELWNLDGEFVRTLRSSDPFGSYNSGFITNGNIIYYLVTEGNGFSVWMFDIRKNELSRTGEINEQELIAILNFSKTSSGQPDPSLYAYGLSISPNIVAADDRRLYISCRIDGNGIDAAAYSLIYLDLIDGEFVPFANYSSVSLHNGKSFYETIYNPGDAVSYFTLYILNADSSLDIRLDDVSDYKVIGNMVYYFHRTGLMRYDMETQEITTLFTGGSNVSKYTIYAISGYDIYYNLYSDHPDYFNVAPHHIYNFVTGESWPFGIPGADPYTIVYPVLDVDGEIYAVVDRSIYKFNPDTKTPELFYTIPEGQGGDCSNIISAHGKMYLVMSSNALGYRISYLVPHQART